MTDMQAKSAQELRRCAEEKFKNNSELSSETLTSEEINPLFHELQVHQIELEMQNDELRRIQHDLEISRAEYFDLYELAPVGYLTVSEQGLIQKANLSAVSMFSVALNTLIKKTLSELVFPEDQDQYCQYLTKVITQGEKHDIVLRMVWADGLPFWVHLQSTKSDSGEQRITLTDVSEQKKNENEIRRNEELFRAIFDLSTVGKSLTATNGKLLRVNRTFADMVGYSIEEMQQLDFARITHPDDIAKSFECINGLMTGKQSTFRFEKRYIHKNGAVVWGDVSTVMLRDEQGVPLHLITSIVDITERKRAEEARLLLEQQFQQAQKLESLGILAGGIAHDFNNILSVIICNCSLLLQRPQMLAELVPEIDTAAQRAADLCRQMLIYAGKAQPIPTKFNVKTLVEEMVKMLRATINQNVTTTFDSSTDIPAIRADASQIRQVVMNLIINASEAIGTEQVNITISLASTEIEAGQGEKDYLGNVITPGSYVCLNVTDDGCGMDEGTKQRIFEPFYTTKFTGRGLGMSAVLGIIKAHNGALQLASQQGVGTTFKVYLPVQGGEPVGDLLQNVSLMPWQGIGTVMLVEDEPQLRIVAKELLQTLGFSVIEAGNGQVALESYQKNANDITLVLTDIGMPVMDGYELIRELKVINPELPIIVSSGFGDAEVTSRIRENIAGLVSKPYSFDQLREVLKKAVEGKRT